MKINPELIIESDIPFQSVSELELHWTVNEHANAVISGLLKNSYSESIGRQDYRGSSIQLIWMEEEDGKEQRQILFHGMIREVLLSQDSHISSAVLFCSSYSVKLDEEEDKKDRIFQTQSQTYRELAGELVREQSGQVICTVGKEPIQTPLLCYRETTWEFLKRIASHHQSYLVADIRTGKPNLWFGMREGRQIAEEVSEANTDLEILRIYRSQGKERMVKRYRWDSRKRYQIGDWAYIGQKKCVIFAMDLSLKKGEVTTAYSLSELSDLEVEKQYNDHLTGLSLWGTVQETQREEMRINFDCDEKEGDYFYPWKPETGNSLYAMPETGMKAAVYFMTSEEKEAVAVRCQNAGGETDEPRNKYLKTSEQTGILLETDCLELSKEESLMKMHDSSGIRLSGQEIQLNARGSVRMCAKNMYLSASDEIRAVTE